MNINVQFTPRWLEWDDLQRRALLDVVLNTLSTHVPELRQQILDIQLLTPLDLEREFSLSEGDIYQGQMGLDQLLFMRPIPGFPRYKMPLGDLYLCGAGAHPGGGLTGAPGYNAARQVLRQFSAQ
jgi:phytoene dehydrogenase-like protein